MRRALALVLAAALLPLAAAPVPAARGGGLTVTVENVADARGDIRVGVFAGPERFATKGGADWRLAVPAVAGEVSIHFPDVPPGRYAVTLFHDADRDGEIDRLLGALPTEGWGASNNPGPFTRPTWDNAGIDVPAEGAIIRVRLNY